MARRSPQPRGAILHGETDLDWRAVTFELERESLKRAGRRLGDAHGTSGAHSPSYLGTPAGSPLRVPRGKGGADSNAELLKSHVSAARTSHALCGKLSLLATPFPEAGSVLSCMVRSFKERGGALYLLKALTFFLIVTLITSATTRGRAGKRVRSQQTFSQRQTFGGSRRAERSQ